MTKKEVQERVIECEKRGRFVAKKVLDEVLSEAGNTDIEIKGYSYTEKVDLRAKSKRGEKSYDFDIEVKERNKSDYILYNYPSAELKEAKLNSLIDVCKSGRKVLYIQLLNRVKAFLYWITPETLKCKTEEIFNKVTEVDDDSAKVKQKIYQLPYKDAYKVVDITQYYLDYANNQ